MPGRSGRQTGPGGLLVCVVDIEPAPQLLVKAGNFVVLPELPALAVDGDEFDQAFPVLGAAVPGGEDLQAEPVAAFRPVANVGLAGADALFGAPGAPQVIDGGQHVGGVAGAH